MELRLLRYFLTVAKEQSFTKAAEQLHITQPTLSRQMAAFEEDLGITLFIRNGKKISLTDEGILLKRRALEILIAFTSNLGTNAGVMAANGLGYPISIEGAAKYWREDILVQRRISPEIKTRACLKNHSRNLHAPLCGIFHPNSVAVARYGALIRAKYPTNCDAHLAESLFQTRSSTVIAWRRNIPYSLAVRKMIEEINAFQA